MVGTLQIVVGCIYKWTSKVQTVVSFRRNSGHRKLDQEVLELLGWSVYFTVGTSLLITWWPVNCTAQQSVKHWDLLWQIHLAQSTNLSGITKQLNSSVGRDGSAVVWTPDTWFQGKIELKYPLILSASYLELAAGSKEDSFLESVIGLLLSRKLCRLGLFKDVII